MQYIETNANENIINERKDKEKDKIIKNEIKLEKDEDNDEEHIDINKGYHIKGNCLIISMAEMTDEIKKELKKLLFATILKDDSPYIYKPFYNSEENKKHSNKRKKEEIKENKEKENEINDYIQIYKKNGIPYEKRTSYQKILKIIFKDCSFNKESLYNLKDFFMMLSYYKNLFKISIYKNNMSYDFSGWKYFKQLVRENFNIRWVSFKGANLNDKLFESIIMGMTLKRIRYLNLSKNKITNKGLYFLNKFLMKNQTLLILDLSYNQNVTNEGIKLITNALKMHPNIYKVDLSYMRIKGSGHYISNFIRDNKCLRKLYLKNCKKLPI